MDYLTSNPCGHAAGCVPDFRHAAESLAQAALSLSEAARAMSSAAEALSIATPSTESLRSHRCACSIQSIVPGEITSPQRGAAAHDLGEQTDPERQPTGHGDLFAEVDDKEEIEYHFSGDDYYTSDEDEDYINALLKQQQDEKAHRNTLATLPNSILTDHASRSPVVRLPGQSSAPSTVAPDSAANPAIQTPSPIDRKRILVQTEADILLVVSALSQRYDKVFCYMQYPTPSLGLYQKIMKDTSKTFVYVMAANWSSNSLPKMFEKQKKAMMLFHETFGASPPPGAADNFCIIHVGWPRSTERYLLQTACREASLSVLIACSDDQNVCPAGSEILSFTTPWPDQDYESLRTVLPEVKGKAYTDWIEAYGQGGQRYVPSWTPSVLVKRANIYVLETLQYGTVQQSATLHTDQQSPPPVSVQFVKQNKLEPAAREGLLRIIQGSPGLNSMLDLDTGDQRTTPGVSATGDTPQTLPQKGYTVKPKHTTNRQPQCYSYILRDEFDVLPTLQSATLADIITINNLSLMETTNAANQLSMKKHTVLLLAGDVCPQYTPEEIFERYNPNPDIARSNQHRADTNILLACMQDVDLFPAGLKILGQVTPYPNRAEIEAQMISTRAAVGSVLLHEPAKTKEQFYIEWIHDHGPSGRRRVLSWTPITLALRANDYLIHVLRYQPDTADATSLKEGESLPPLPVDFIDLNGLRRAAEIGILNMIPLTANEGRESPTKPFTGVTQLQPPTPLPNNSVAKDAFNKSDSGASSTATSQSLRPLLRRHLFHEDECDTVPLLCCLTRNMGHKNTICFVKVIFAWKSLAPLISQVVSKPVFVVSYNLSPEIISSINQASESPTGCLVFCSILEPLTEQLRNRPFSQSIHIGWISHGNQYQDQTQISGLSSSFVILPKSDPPVVAPQELGTEGPWQYTPTPEDELIACYEKWKEQLASAPRKQLKQCYMEWILFHHSGLYKVVDWSGVQLITHANEFARNVLLHGDSQPAAPMLVGGTLSVTPGFVRQWGLQPAVDAKVLRVE
ncbi:hypothetical protein FRC09_007321 [Ceratobasidium sp. 395]|nr:hypothetical protein FRC09_007321 [Ceratobasidium sp. 395]